VILRPRRLQLIPPGAIIACALFVNGWSVEDCIASFEDLARLAFKPRRSAGLSRAYGFVRSLLVHSRYPFRNLETALHVLSKAYEFVSSLVVDSRYPARNLEAALQAVFGSTRSMVECSTASEMGTMVGVPVTTIRNVSTCVFTNYNGVGKRESSSGKAEKTKCISRTLTSVDYHIMPPEEGTRRSPLWEV
jgi:hypothetical protein